MSRAKEGIETDNSETPSRTKNTFLGEIRANFLRWFRKFVRSSSAIVMDLVQPIIFLFLFTEVFSSIATEPISESLGSR